MKKIGILTLPGNFNYGNRLQNYALQTVLEKRNYQVETLDISFSRKSNAKKILAAFIRCCLSPSLLKLLFHKREYNSDSFSDMSKLKTPKIMKFTENFIKTRYIFSNNELNDVVSQFDFFITGSDQVWNQSSISDSTYFLDFAPFDKRYSYAASFAKAKILNADRRYYKKNINNMKKISVREDQGRKIVNELTDRDAEVHVDPTMLLTSKEWRELALQEDLKWLPEKKFVLVYTLRGMDDEKKRELKEFIRKKDYEVISVMGNSIEENSQILTVIQFIQAIDNAEFVLTDSFHGTVFSIIFESPFQVLESETGKTNSRLDTLLEKFNLERNSSKQNNTFYELLETNFANSKKILVKEKEKSKDYFDSFLGE